MLNLKNTLDGYLKNVEVIGNTIQDENNLANIRSVGDKVEGQELYKIDVVSNGKNLLNLPYTQNNKLVSKKNLLAEFSFKVKLGTTYTFSLKQNVTGNNGSSLVWAISYDKTFSGTNKIFTTVGTVASCTFTATSEVVYFIGGVCKSNEYYDFQLEEGTVATPYEPYQENKLEILSPVQLEKVGKVADRLICKDGVWGVEKHIYTVSSDVFYVHADKKMWYISKGKCPSWVSKDVWNQVENKIICNYYKEVAVYSDVVNGTGIFLDHKGANPNIIIGTGDANITSLPHDLEVKYQLTHPQFIPLPHDQQVKLRTFAGQTNIAFLTEIPGQIKAQVPKSLGATVNTHTEQIADLHNSLDRVKKLEETTVSTIETVSNFTTVDATSNGYFEDVKLEGKTLVNLFDYSKLTSNSTLTVSEKKISVTGYSNRLYLPEVFACNKTYTIKGSNYGKSNSDVYINQGKILLISKDSSISKTIDVIDFNKTDIATFTIPSDYNSANYHGLYFYGSSGNTTSIENIIILEGDHTNNPPEYFEGLLSVGQDVEEVSVESANKNLFNGNIKNQTINTNGIIASDEKARSTDFIKVPNDYDITISVKMLNQDRCAIVEYDANKQFIKFNNATSLLSNGVYTFKTDKNTKYIIYYYNSSTQIADEDIPNYIMVNVGTELNPCILHQSNKKPLLYYNPTTEMWEKPILREWDTIEKHSDGKYYYHKRSGEVVLNGSENWDTLSSNDMENTILFRLDGFLDSKGDNVLVCDKFQNMNVYSSDLEGAYVGGLSGLRIRANRSKLSTQDVAGFKAWLKANPTTVVYQLAKEEVYECTNIDLMTYSGETNYIINSGAIPPKSTLKVHNNISNVVKILQEKVSLLENTFIAGLKSVLSGDMYSLATILYPEDFEQNDNTEQDIMVIPE